MQRRKFLTALGATAAGGAAVIGTGAFSSASAERQYTLNVAGDASAYLTIKTGDESGPQARQTSDGTVEFDFTAGQGAGVNNEAFTKYNDLFAVQNKGPNRVAVWLNEGQSDDNVVETKMGASADLVESLATSTGQPEASVAAALFWAISNRSKTSSYDPFGTDSNGNDFEYGLDDSGVLRPDNVETNIIELDGLAVEHPAVLDPGEEVWCTHMINTKSDTGADLNPSNVDDFTGTITVNGYTAGFVDDEF